MSKTVNATLSVVYVFMYPLNSEDRYWLLGAFFTRNPINYCLLPFPFVFCCASLDIFNAVVT